MNERVRVWGVLTPLVLVTGCGSPPPAVEPLVADPPAETGDVAWPFWPAWMRIHPLTRLTRSDDGLLIEARLEFFDADDDTTKALGRVRLDLHPADRLPDPTSPIASWSHDLRDLAVNRRHFDDVTRTYLFRLGVQPSQVQEPADLYAYFLSVNGQPLPPAEPLRLRLK